MSIRIIQNIWEKSTTSGNDRVLMLAIADNADDDGYAFPGYRNLLGKVNVVNSTLSDCIKRCEQAGELYVNREQKRNRYIVLPMLNNATIIKVLIKQFEMDNETARETLNQIRDAQAERSKFQSNRKSQQRSKFQSVLEQPDCSSGQSSTALSSRAGLDRELRAEPSLTVIEPSDSIVPTVLDGGGDDDKGVEDEHEPSGEVPSDSAASTKVLNPFKEIQSMTVETVFGGNNATWGDAGDIANWALSQSDKAQWSKYHLEPPFAVDEWREFLGWYEKKNIDWPAAARKWNRQAFSFRSKRKKTKPTGPPPTAGVKKLSSDEITARIPGMV